MIKLFSFIASCSGSGSNTARFSELAAARLAGHAAALGVAIEYEAMTGDGIHIDFCRSCESCFDRGICPLDSCDDMAVLKQKMLTADMLMFCSPVYAGGMSGLAKSVIDRLAYWCHRFELAGKPAAILATASQNLGSETLSDIEKPISCMGASLACTSCAYRHSGHPGLHNSEEMNTELDRISRSLLDCLEDPAAYITAEQEAGFRYYRSMYRAARVYADIIGTQPKEETIVFEQRGLADHGSLAEYVRSLK